MKIKLLINISDIDNYISGKRIIPGKCNFCDKLLYFDKREVNRAIKLDEFRFCDSSCSAKYRMIYILNRELKKTIKCTLCNKEFDRSPRLIRVNNFCSSSCSTTYNNRNKKYGYRRSKLEIYIEKQLKLKFPDLKILFNEKSEIGSELDIYIPSLSLAFEINGIFHYKKIYSEETFKRIVKNDLIKSENCKSKNIELVIIDSSELCNFTNKKADVYLESIITKINYNINHLS